MAAAEQVSTLILAGEPLGAEDVTSASASSPSTPSLLSLQALEDAWDELFQVRLQLEQSLDESPVIQSKVAIANVHERLKSEGPTAALAELDSIAPQLALLDSPEVAEGARVQLDEARAFLEQGEVGAAISSLMAADEAVPLTEPSHG